MAKKKSGSSGSKPPKKPKAKSPKARGPRKAHPPKKALTPQEVKGNLIKKLEAIDFTTLKELRATMKEEEGPGGSKKMNLWFAWKS